MHISVCIITFQRPVFLKRLLEKLKTQETSGLFTWSVVVVDNDAGRTAEPVVAEARARLGLEIAYHLESRKNLALARNMALQKARGDFAAFIDDDEFPTERWLFELQQACARFQADGVLGPVEPHYENEVPRWIEKIRLFHHPRYPSGRVLVWNETRSGNVLLKLSLIQDESNLFDPAFGTHGEDKDFFKRLIAKGFKFVWCDEAVAYETQPAKRLERRYHLRRGLLRGSVAYTHAQNKLKLALTSAVALCLYTPALPLLQLSGHHNFMKYLIKDCDHLGKLLAFFGCRLEGRISL